MALRKLWNTICGHKSLGQNSTDGTIPASAADPSGAAKTAHPSSTPTRHKKTSRGILGLGRGPHDSLCRLIRKTNAKSILEISVGDGSRAVAVVSALAKANPGSPIRYSAIDQFELSGGSISLMQFHRDLRQHGIRPQIFPGDVKSGLIRVAHTIGAVDLVLISSDGTQIGDFEVPPPHLLSRVSHPESLILRRSEDTWTRFDNIQTTQQVIRRAA